MPKRGGGIPFETIKVKVSQAGYVEAMHSAVSMGQTLEIWASDAIAHHVYRCEQLHAQERYRADVTEAARNCLPTPVQYDARYQVTRPKPTITRPTGQGHDSSAGSAYEHWKGSPATGNRGRTS